MPIPTPSQPSAEMPAAVLIQDVPAANLLSHSPPLPVKSEFQDTSTESWLIPSVSATRSSGLTSETSLWGTATPSGTKTRTSLLYGPVLTPPTVLDLKGRPPIEIIEIETDSEDQKLEIQRQEIARKRIQLKALDKERKRRQLQQLEQSNQALEQSIRYYTQLEEGTAAGNKSRPVNSASQC